MVIEMNKHNTKISCEDGSSTEIKIDEDGNVTIIFSKIEEKVEPVELKEINNGWKRIDDEIPYPNQRVLATAYALEQDIRILHWSSLDSNWFDDNNNLQFDEPKYWRELPEPPMED